MMHSDNACPTVVGIQIPEKKRQLLTYIIYTMEKLFGALGSEELYRTRNDVFQNLITLLYKWISHKWTKIQWDGKKKIMVLVWYYSLGKRCISIFLTSNFITSTKNFSFTWQVTEGYSHSRNLIKNITNACVNVGPAMLDLEGREPVKVDYGG